MFLGILAMTKNGCSLCYQLLLLLGLREAIKMEVVSSKFSVRSWQTNYIFRVFCCKYLAFCGFLVLLSVYSYGLFNLG